MVRYARESLNHEATRLWPRYILAYTYFDADDFNNAIREFEKIDKGVRHPKSSMALARAYYELGDYEESLKLLNAVRSKLEGARGKAHDLRPLLLNSLANTLYRMEEFEKSLDVYRELLKINPNDPGATYGVGLMLVALGRCREAIAVMEKLPVKDDKSRAASDTLIGAAYRDLGQERDAVKMYRSALSVDQSYADALDPLSEIFYQRGEYAELLQINQRALEAGSTLPEVYARIGFALLHLGRYSEGIEVLEDANSNELLGADGHHALGLCYYMLGNEDLTLKEHELLQTIDPAIADQLLADIKGFEEDG
jgi:tetratricopeptide (TPR) repeat protein